jgi:xylulose-5-phosphate/fructose-6-phosphate phosphoketolase
MSHCFASENYVNVVVADKQEHLQYLDMEAAVSHCTKGLGIWEWASSFPNEEPDLVMACAGDTVTAEALAATALLKEHLPKLKIRFVNVVDLFRLISHDDHPHGLTDLEFDSIFTRDKPIIFNFHSYPWLIHRLTYRRTGSRNIHVSGYREKGNIDTPLELAIRNGADRFTLAISAIDTLSQKGGVLNGTGGMIREKIKDQKLRAKNFAFTNGIDDEPNRTWVWEFGGINGEGKSEGRAKGVLSKVKEGLGMKDEAPPGEVVQSAA